MLLHQIPVWPEWGYVELLYIPCRDLPGVSRQVTDCARIPFDGQHSCCTSLPQARSIALQRRAWRRQLTEELPVNRLVLAAMAIVLCSCLMGSAYAQTTPRPGPSTPVQVTNDASTPVPVTLQGTGSVSGTVSAVQSGSWNVGVNGTVASQNVDEPGRNPFSALHDPFAASPSCILAGGGFQDCTFSGGFPTVPAGKRLVITNFSGQARAPSGCKVASISLGTSNEGGGTFNHPFTFAVPHPNPAIAEVASFHERTLAYVEAGSSPTFGVSASCAGISAGSQVVTISGYFVSLP